MAAGFGKRLSWRIEAFGHSFMAYLFSFISADDVFRVGECIGKFIWPLMSRRREISIRNLRIAYAPLEYEEAAKMARASFIRAFANLLSSSISASSLGENIEDFVVVENPEMLEEACAQGRGVLLLLAHMGNWELLTRLNHFVPKGIKCGAFYRPLNNLILDDRVLKLREESGVRLFSKRDSLHHIGGFLRDNGLIGILADQRAGFQGVGLNFFGRFTRVSPLPSLFVRRCKCEVLSLSMRTISPGKWSVRYHKVEKPYDSENCFKAIEDAMNVSPLDVFWLQERWKLYINRQVTPKKWIIKDGVISEKPHRMVFWLNENEPEPILEKDFVHADFVWEFISGKRPQDLEEIDRSKPLPIDFIFVNKIDNELKKAAHQLAIPIMSYLDFKITPQ
jgi:Kdo2-lipid IVA lauroyltransferase/acyltransferase